VAPLEANPVQVKLTAEQREVIERAAREAGLPVSSWLRQVALVAAGRADLSDSPVGDHPMRLLVVTMADGGSRHWVAAPTVAEARAMVNFEYAPRSAGAIEERPTTYDGTPVRRVFLGQPRPHIIASEGRLPFRIGHRVAYVQTPDSPTSHDGKIGRIVGVHATPGAEYTVAYDDGSRATMPSAWLTHLPTPAHAPPALGTRTRRRPRRPRGAKP
jgi:hypothetical protein